MPALFLDASALVKRWVAEKGTAWIRQQTAPGTRNPLFVARFVGPEIAGVLTRAVRGGRVLPREHAAAIAELRADLANRLEIVEMTRDVLDQATEMALTHGLKGADAVHLAAARAVGDALRGSGGSALTFVSSDGELLAAAPTYGLSVENPATHALPSE